MVFEEQTEPISKTMKARSFPHDRSGQFLHREGQLNLIQNCELLIVKGPIEERRGVGGGSETFGEQAA
jgi:hypothetical protein